MANSKKTFEGALVGLAVLILALGPAKFVYFTSVSVSDFFLVLILIGVSGQIEDPFESAAKRSADVQTSGSLLGGQAGFLDTLDSFVFTAPVSPYYLAVWIRDRVVNAFR